LKKRRSRINRKKEEVNTIEEKEEVEVELIGKMKK